MNFMLAIGGIKTSLQTLCLIISCAYLWLTIDEVQIRGETSVSNGGDKDRQSCGFEISSFRATEKENDNATAIESKGQVSENKGKYDWTSPT